MKSYRVILANQPRLLRGLLHRVLSKTPDIQVVGEVTDLEALRPELEETDAQWVVVPMWQSGGFPAPLHRLLQLHPAVCLLGLSPDGSQAKVRCPDGREATLSSISLEDLLAMLRSREAMEILHPPGL